MIQNEKESELLLGFFDSQPSQSYKIVLKYLEVSKIISTFANKFARTGCTSAILSKLNGSRFAPSLHRDSEKSRP